MDRVEKALHAIDLSGRGIEVGPSYNPLVPKSSGRRIETVDHAHAEELVAKYTAMGLSEEHVARIEAVDHLWSGGSLLDVIPDHGSYDYIIASHFIEHTVDMVRFLQDCEVLLRDGGRLSLVVPDKRFCFDRFQPLSTVGDVIDAFHAQHTFHTAGPLVDHQAYACTSGGSLVWSAEYRAPVELQFPNLEGAEEAARNGLEQKTYFDTHRWKFTPTSFELLIGDLAELGHHAFGVVESLPTEGFEFFVTLGKGTPRPEPRVRVALLQAIEDELAQTASEEPSPGTGAETRREVEVLRQQNARLEQEISDLRASTSWRVTAPLRSVVTRLR
ncbi:MAG: methyltransferase domain-containing protein, partial [Jatrophihabitantaceae bacterium]